LSVLLGQREASEKGRDRQVYKICNCPAKFYVKDGQSRRRKWLYTAKPSPVMDGEDTTWDSLPHELQVRAYANAPTNNYLKRYTE